MSKKFLAVALTTAFFFSACSEDDSISSSEFHGADYLFTSQSELNKNACNEEHENSTAYFKPEGVFLVCEYSDKYEEWVWTDTDSSLVAREKSSSSANGKKSSSSKKKESSDKSSSSSVKSSSSSSTKKAVRDTTSAPRPNPYTLPELDSTSIDVVPPCIVDSVDNCKYETFKDERDGQTYKAVVIGTQTWMTENLRFQYHSSSAYAGCPGRKQTYSLNSCGFTTFDDTECPADSVFYTWAAAMDSAGLFSEDGMDCGDSANCYPAIETQGACPEGWHLPNTNEWKVLRFSINQGNVDSLNARGFNAPQKAADSWSPSKYYWSSSKYYLSSPDVAYIDDTKIGTGSINIKNTPSHLIRCIKNTSDSIRKKTTYFVDERNGEFYKTVKIGEQTWMAQNLQYPYRKSAVHSYEDYPVLACDDIAGYSIGYQLNHKYSWAAVMDSLGYFDGIGKGCGSFVDCDIKEKILGLCPKGWHIPDSTEWAELLEFVKKDNPEVGTANSLASFNFSKRATNKYSFNVTNTGYAHYIIGAYSHPSENAYYWTTSQHSDFTAISVTFDKNRDDVIIGRSEKDNMYSIRCIAD